MALRRGVSAAVLIVLVCFAGEALARKHDKDGLFKELKPQGVDVAFQGDAGTLEVWGKDFDAMQDANVVAGRVTLKPGGFIMPAYINFPALKVIVKGSLRVGIINPLTEPTTQENVYKLKKGDVVALPQGVASWWFNDGNEDAVVLCVANRKSSPQPASFMEFFLAGGKQKQGDSQMSFGSVLQGFSVKFLAQAWDVSEAVVQKIVTSQAQGGIINIPNGMMLPDVSPPANNNTTGLNNMDFIYHYADAFPDLRVEQGGEIRELNSLKMPILQTVGMGAECVKLNQSAMVAPNWFHNGHQILYVERGSGRLQVVSNGGGRVLDLNLQEGSLVVIPRFFPSTCIAGDKGLKFVSVVTTDRPVVSFLGGSNSVYSSLPTQVLSSAFNVDGETAKQLQQSNKAVIIPSKQRGKSFP